MFGDLQFSKVLEFNYAVFYIYFVLLCVLSDKEGSEEKGNVWLEVMAKYRAHSQPTDFCQADFNNTWDTPFKMNAVPDVRLDNN